MAIDSGLTADQRIYLAAHDATAETAGGDTSSATRTGGDWWLSPDVLLVTGNNSSTPLDRLTPGDTGWIKVTYRAKRDAPIPQGAEDVSVEAWVGDPYLVMRPGVSNAFRITPPGGDSKPLIASGASAPAWYSFATVTDTGAPNGQGHRCLIARCHADSSLSAASDDLHRYAPEDQHYAQHNIGINFAQPAPSPPAPPPPGDGGGDGGKPDPDGLWIQTTAATEQDEAVVIRALFDQRPSVGLLRALRRYPAFKEAFGRFSAKPPPGGFKLSVARHERVKMLDFTRYKGRLTAKQLLHQDARLVLRPKENTWVRIQGDFSRAPRGHAYVFHVVQMSSASRRVQGGFTFVRVIT